MTEDEVYVNLYMCNKAELNVGGQNVILNQKTEYPWEESVDIAVNLQDNFEFTLCLRIPHWSKNCEIFVNDEKIKSESLLQNGYAKIRRKWSNKDSVRIILGMDVERIYANPNVRANLGKVALQRGPVIYCLEEVDNTKNLPAISLPKDTTFKVEFDKNLLGGVVVIRADAVTVDSPGTNSKLYTSKPYGKKPIEIKAVPYFTWANREPGEMLVWIREEADSSRSVIKNRN